jgi:tRNA(Ile)-lysidine synthase
MNKFVRNLLTEWRKLNLPLADEAIVVAVSGGADSVSLALALHNLRERKKLNLNFIIAHFNHNLRGIESDKDAEFVKDLAEKLNFKFQISNFKSNLKNQKGNLEQNARNVRYEFLQHLAENELAFAILTAHTKNDQAETLLFNLIRGSGLDGLAGMKQRQKVKGKRQNEFFLIRPLLSWASRADTEKFCYDSEIEFRHDAMNDDLKFSRVRIRKEIIPLLEKINPNVIETLSNTASLLREEAESLQIDEQEVPEILSQDELKKMPKPRQIRVLRAWLLKHRGNLRRLELKHFAAIERLLNSNKSGRIAELPDGQKVLKKDGKLFFEKSTVEKTFLDN